MSIKTMRDLYIDQLTELYNEETHSLRVFPAMERAAQSPQLAEHFHKHLDMTNEHIRRLDGIFADLGHKPHKRESRCEQGLFVDCMALSRNKTADPYVRDAAMVAVAQHVEHDEIAGYGCAKAWARLLGEDKAVQALEQTLTDEKKSDADLTHIAEKIHEQVMAAMA